MVQRHQRGWLRKEKRPHGKTWYRDFVSTRLPSDLRLVRKNGKTCKDLKTDRGRRATFKTRGGVLLQYSSRFHVNEFYKKGCQEKSSASTGGSRFFLEIQPTLVSLL